MAKKWYELETRAGGNLKSRLVCTSCGSNGFTEAQLRAGCTTAGCEYGDPDDAPEPVEVENPLEGFIEASAYRIVLDGEEVAADRVKVFLEQEGDDAIAMVEVASPPPPVKADGSEPSGSSSDDVPPPPDKDAKSPLDEMERPELLDLAKTLGIPRRMNLTAAKLRDAIRQAQAT